MLQQAPNTVKPGFPRPANAFALEFALAAAPTHTPMRLSQRIAQHLAHAIDTTALAADPFAHLSFDGVFPLDVYDELLVQLPADGYYRELKHSDAVLPGGRSARLQFPLVPGNIARLPAAAAAFWREVVAGLTAPAVDAAYKAKFSVTLEALRGCPVDRIKLRHYPTLFRDLGGYRISIHPDSPRKAITAQFYLPVDDSQTHLGTRFHARNADGSFREVRAMRFAPNTGYAFAVTPDSWHSVEPMRADDKPRNSLMVIVFHDRGPLVEGFKAARASLRGWYDRMVGARAGAPEAGEGRIKRM